MELNYKDIIPKFDASEIRNPINMRVKTLIFDYVIDLDITLNSGVNLQRGYVWSDEQKQDFIKSIFKGNKIPEIHAVIYEDDLVKTSPKPKPILKVIDGKQRLSTFIDFLNGDFPIIHQNKEYYFDDFDKQSQLFLTNYSDFRFRIMYEYPDALISDETLINWFEYVNYSATPQDNNHLLNLRKSLNK